MQCEGIIPERTVPVRSEVVTDDDGAAVTDEAGQVVKRIITETTPEHRCEADATMLARSLTQELCSLGEPHWVKAGPDRAYCAACFRPGTVTDRNGRASAHPAMSIDDHEG